MHRQFKVLGTSQEFLSRLRPAAARPRSASAYPTSRLVLTLGAAMATCAALVAVAGPAAADGQRAFLSGFNTVTTVSTTVPENGDLNPYGIVNVPQSTGLLVRGDTLVSNFNASSNAQGTGTTIVEISPRGQQRLFSQINPTNLPGPCPGGVGLTTALTVLAGGFVVVGSLPTNSSGDPEAGCLIVLNSDGVPVETWSGGDINGPWDMTMLQFPRFAELFVTNVLNGIVPGGTAIVPQGTVIRILVTLPPGQNPIMLGSTVIATGFDEQLNSAALILGPTGVALGRNGVLYVADTVNSRIDTVPFAALRHTPVTDGGGILTSGGSINAPLGMTLAPNGNIITVNGGDGNAVETTPQGAQIDTVQIDPAGMGGDLFGLTIAPDNRSVLFVDDGDNTLKLFSQSHGSGHGY
jgi:hypothetical protein